MILDEVQTLPRRLLGPLLGMMRELAEDWGDEFVFSTATQPAFERPSNKKDLRWEPGTLTEIVRDPAPLRKALKRAEIHWEIEHGVDWPEVAERMLAAPQCLAIVNLRNHASQLYARSCARRRTRESKRERSFILSTRMCAAHRLRKLERFASDCGRRALPRGFHAIGGSRRGRRFSAGAALRSLRSIPSSKPRAAPTVKGKITAELGRPGGKVVVFLPEDNRMPPNEYDQAARITERWRRQRWRAAAACRWTPPKR